MSEPYDRNEASDDNVGSRIDPPDLLASPNNALHLGQSLLRQSIDQLERLCDEYRQIHILLDRLGEQLSQHEAQVGQRLREVMSWLARARADAAGDPEAQGDVEHGFSLRVQTMGRFSVHWGDRELDLGSSKKGRAAFRYLLACSGGHAAKEVLLELFWPEEEADKARHKLHIAISTLRQALRDAISAACGQSGYTVEPDLLENCILFEEEGYGLHPAIHIDLDADEFVAHYQTGERMERERRAGEAMQEYQSAMALYKGDFLAEDLYADWAVAPRARLEEIYLTLLGRLALHYQEEGGYTESIACCRQILIRDSFREDAYRHLMRCYSRMGRRNEALLEYARCAEVLQRELGVHPMRETVELHDQIAREEDV